jgi:hypothetical protein
MKGLKFYTRNSRAKDGTPEVKLVEADMGILIEHNGQHYTLNLDSFDRLVLTALGGVGLELKPTASNRIIISSEDFASNW